MSPRWPQTPLPESLLAGAPSLHGAARSEIADLYRAGGGLCAFLSATSTILYDCHGAIEKRAKRVPIPVVKLPAAWLLAGLGGAAATTAFWQTDPKGNSVIDTLLTLKISNDLFRGIVVGLMVLAIIRSRVTNLEGFALGPEQAYLVLRSWVLGRCNVRWSRHKEAFLRQKLPAAFSIADYDSRIAEKVEDGLGARSEDEGIFTRKQLATVLGKRPEGEVDYSKSEWRTYYRTLTNLALDAVGEEYLAGLFI